MKKLLYIILVSLIFPLAMSAQRGERQIVQFSGFAMSSDSMMGIPFAHIGCKGTTRAGTARVDGFFSYAVAEGDTLIFTSIGYSPYTYIVPYGNVDNKISTIISMEKHEYKFRDVMIYPWGDPANFHNYFVHVKIPKTLQEIGEANTDRQLLAAIGQYMPVDGGEATQRFMQYQAVQASYYNQQAPQNIFNPLAWAEFIKAIKNGDFKPKPAPTAPAQPQDY